MEGQENRCAEPTAETGVSPEDRPDESVPCSKEQELEQGNGSDQVGRDTELSDVIAVKERQYEELAAQYLRLRADFDNFRRRTRQEMEQLAGRAAESLIRNLLPVLDNLDRALEAATSLDGGGSIAEGVKLVQRGLVETLAAEGLEELPGVGAPFDPRWHEAVEMQDNEAGGDSGEPIVVVAEYRKGYLLAGRVLRPAMVRVGPAPVENAD